MFCPVCGKQAAQGAAFCDNCGASLPAELRQDCFAPAQNAAQAQPRYGYPPKKSRKVLLAVLIVCGLVLAGAAAAVILLTEGTPVLGFWYNKDTGEAIRFDADNSLRVFTPGEEQKGKYTYNSGEGKGIINIEGEEYAFKLRKNELDAETLGEFIKAGEDFDLKRFLKQAAKAMPTPEPTPVPTPTPQPTPQIVTVINESMTLTLAFGAVPGKYTGETVDGLPHGYGIFTSADYDYGGWSYEGDWLEGHMNGQGTTTWGGGFYQTGQYSGDYLNGQGSEYWSNVLYYEGDYKDGLFHGEGTIYNTHGEMIYSGSWAYGYRAESEEDKEARLGKFKEVCVSASCEELYEACEGGIGMKVVVKGVVLDAYVYDEQSYYCDFLMYEKGIEDKDRIIQVYYHLGEREAPFIEGQEVTVWGTTEYLYYYTTQGNENLVVPLIEAWSVE